jgi:hypothetical protein
MQIDGRMKLKLTLNKQDINAGVLNFLQIWGQIHAYLTTHCP